MFVNNGVKRGGTVNAVQPDQVPNTSNQNWRVPEPPGTPPPHKSRRKDHRRLLAVLSIVLLVMLVLASVRVMSVESGNDDQLVLKVGNQQQALIDLRQPGTPISPYLFGVNVFPKVGTTSLDSVNGNA